MPGYDFSKTKSTKARVLAAIRYFSTISIKDIANYCDLSIPIVTRYVETMLQEGLLKEHKTSVSTVGRKPKQFSLNADYGYIIGIELGLLYMAKIGVFAFDGTLIVDTSLNYSSSWSADEIINAVMDTIDTHLDKCSIDSMQLRYLVIGNPGIVNPETGSIELAAKFASWKEMPLKQIFENRFCVSVEVLNDVNLSAIGEKEFGIGHGYNNFIIIRQSVGLKAGIILKNRLYQGEAYAAGEIGDSVISVMENGVMVHKKAEQYLCLPPIYEQIASELSDNPNDIFYSITGGNPKNVTADNIAKALGTPSYINDHIIKAGEMLGYVLVNVVATLDIALIILSGDIVKFNNYYIKPIRDILFECLTYPPTVLVSTLGDNVALYGAFAVGQEKILTKI